MSPRLAFALGWLVAWLPFLAFLGILWVRERREDRYWLKKTEPLRDELRRRILTDACCGKRLTLRDFPPEDRKVLEEVSQ